MVRHTVVFKLKHNSGSAEELNFLETIQTLSEIPTVKNLELLKQVSKKNGFTFGLSMEFDSYDDYEFYNQHKSHVDFVENRWIPEVEDFMEIDYEPYNN